MSTTITAQDATTIRTAAFGAVTLMSWAAGSASPHRVATNGSLSLYSATGPVGHVLAEKKRDIKLNQKSATDLADTVLPALAASVALLAEQGLADDFREAVLVAVDAAAQGAKHGMTPPLAAMKAKIVGAMGA